MGKNVILTRQVEGDPVGGPGAMRGVGLQNCRAITVTSGHQFRQQGGSADLVTLQAALGRRVRGTPAALSAVAGTPASRQAL